MRSCRTAILVLCCALQIAAFSSDAVASGTKHLTHAKWRGEVIGQLLLFAKVGSKIYDGGLQFKGRLFEQGCDGAMKDFVEMPNLQFDGAPNVELEVLYGNWYLHTLSVGTDCIAIDLDSGPRKASLTKDLATEFSDLQKARGEGNRLWRAVVK